LERSLQGRRGMQDGLRNLVLSRNKLINLHSTDEPVEFQTVLGVGKSPDRNVQDSTVTTGVRVYLPDVAQPAAVAGTDKPELAMQYLLRQKRPTLACSRGLAPFTSQPVVRRLIKD
jgi:hypothetical protein